MAKKIVLDESSRIPTFTRLHVQYLCGCSFYNDSWKSEKDIPDLCGHHQKAVKAISPEAKCLPRNNDGVLHQSFFKVFKN